MRNGLFLSSVMVLVLAVGSAVAGAATAGPLFGQHMDVTNMTLPHGAYLLLTGLLITYARVKSRGIKRRDGQGSITRAT